jgi:hypothetical protein
MSPHVLEALVAENQDLLDPRWRGIEFGPGWTDLFGEMLTRCRECQAPAITRSKEKLGTLRLHFSDQVHPVAREIRAETMLRSERICEICGNEGRLVIIEPGFIATRCEAHSRS